MTLDELRAEQKRVFQQMRAAYNLYKALNKRLDVLDDQIVELERAARQERGE